MESKVPVLIINCFEAYVVREVDLRSGKVTNLFIC